MFCFFSSLLSEELEFLQNVYFDEMSYEAGPHDQGGHTLQFRVTPSTGDDKERQFVYLVLNITLPKEVRNKNASYEPSDILLAIWPNIRANP